MRNPRQRNFCKRNKQKVVESREIVIPNKHLIQQEADEREID